MYVKTVHDETEKFVVERFDKNKLDFVFIIQKAVIEKYFCSRPGSWKNQCGRAGGR